MLPPCTVGGDLASPRTVAKYIFARGGVKLVVPRAVFRDCALALMVDPPFSVVRLTCIHVLVGSKRHG